MACRLCIIGVYEIGTVWSAVKKRPQTRSSRTVLVPQATLSGTLFSTPLSYLLCILTVSRLYSEFNYARNSDGQCVLASGTQPLPPDDSCRNGEDYWYDRTAYRKIPYSTCEDGLALHQGSRHVCPGIRAHGAAFWFFVLVLPFIFTASVAWWYYRKSGLARGCVFFLFLLLCALDGCRTDIDFRAYGCNNRMIRLPGDTRPAFRSDSGFMSTLASVPWFMVGLAGIAWERISSTAEGLATSMRSRRGYRNIPVDEDAQILRFEDEE